MVRWLDDLMDGLADGEIGRWIEEQMGSWIDGWMQRLID